jgi:hypothetical protein
MSTITLPATTERVTRHTAAADQERIDARTRESVRRYAGRPDDIGRRLGELDREWDIERTLEANAASVMLAGVLLGATIDRRFFLLPAAVAGFLLQHALQGWCPPLPLFRRLGIRTQREIDDERAALKALRGDFARVPRAEGAVDGGLAALDAARV